MAHISQMALSAIPKLNNLKTIALGLATVGMAISIGSSPVQAQQQKQLAQKWFKVCAKQADNDVCNVQYRVVASNGQIVTSVNLFLVSGKINRKIFQITVPTNRLIPAGVAVKIDDKKPNRIPYANCFRDRCTAEVKLDANLTKILKNGGEMLLTSTNFRNKPNPIKITLNGFTAAFEGPALKKSEIDDNQKALQKQLEEKAKKAREKLEAAQKKATE